MNNRSIHLALPPTPQIEPIAKIESINSIENAKLAINILSGTRSHPLSICIDTYSRAISPPNGSYLTLEAEALPSPEDFEALLSWGHSVLMQRYIDKVKQIKVTKTAEANAPIKQNIEDKLRWLRSIQNKQTMPVFPNLPRIHTEYLSALAEMENKGITPQNCILSIPDGWVMGCPNNYWQILLLHSICTIDNPLVDVTFYSKHLKQRYGIDVIEPVRTLLFQKKALYSLGRKIPEIPNSYKVLSHYFKHLVRHNVLARYHRGEYEKVIPFGPAYLRYQA